MFGEIIENRDYHSPPIPNLLGVFMLGFIVRILFLAWRGPGMSPDSSEYLTLAHNLLSHGAFSLDLAAPFTPSIRRAPLYPAFLAMLSWLGLLSPVFVVIVQAILDAAVAAMIVVIARVVLPLKWAMAAAVAYAIHPGAIYASSTVLSEPLFTFLQCGSLMLLVLALQTNRLRLSVCSGLLMGLAVLCRPVAQFLPFLLGGILLLSGRTHRRRWQALILMAIAILVVAPWSLRCSYVSGHLVVVQGNGAVNFWAPSLWSFDQQDQRKIWAVQSDTAKNRKVNQPYTAADAVEDDHLLFQETLRNIRANPLKYAESRARAFPYLFISSFDSFSGINKSFGELRAEHDVVRLGLKIFLLIVFSLAPILLAALGVLVGRRSLPATLCASIWISTLVIHLPLWIEYRFWVPVLPFLLVGAAMGARIIGQRFRSSHHPQSTG
jgi:4-amino-4-deoxy-L-arabinose transferase-like glycosyltransferase